MSAGLTILLFLMLMVLMLMVLMLTVMLRFYSQYRQINLELSLSTPFLERFEG